MIHKPKYEYNENSNWFRVNCKCGFMWAAPTLEECKTRAENHDKRWREIDPSTGKIIEDAA